MWDGFRCDDGGTVISWRDVMIGHSGRHRHWIFLLALFVSGSGLAADGSRMAIMGDAGEAGSDLNRLRSSVKKQNVMSLVMPGDNLYSGSYPQVWDAWKSDGFRFDVVAIGNHHAGYPQEVAYFQMPKEYYSIVKSGARFFVLNSDNERNVDDQFSWLNKEIQQATEKLIFVVYHHPTFSISKNHKWTEKKAFQLRMREFLKSQGSRITALIMGHDHLTSFLNFGNVPAIVSGSGREVRGSAPVSFIDDGFHVQTRYLASETPFWTQLEINAAADEARITSIRVSDQTVECSAQLSHGAMTLDGSCP